MNMLVNGMFEPKLVVDKEYGIDTPVILWVVGHLGILPPHNLPPAGDQTQLTDVDLQHSPLQAV